MRMDREFWEEFLHIYQCLPCLWDSKSPDYSNKFLKENAYKELLNLTTTKYPKANKDFVVRKIHNFRTTFQRELKKVKESQRLGMAAEDVYKPTLWYYNLLLFTADCENPRKVRPNPAINGSEEEQDPGEFSFQEENEFNVENQETDALAGPSSSASSPSSQIKRVKKKKKDDEVIELFDLAKSTLRQYNKNITREDEFDIAGKKIASDLRGLNPQQRVFVEKLIADAIYFGRLEKLNENSIIQLKSPVLNNHLSNYKSEQ